MAQVCEDDRTGWCALELNMYEVVTDRTVPGTSIATQAKPWRELLRVAAERQSELIVPGIQGRGAADLMFFGSTTQHVVRQAVCPVLTVR